MTPVDTVALLQSGRDAGLAAVGVTSAEVFDETRATLERRKHHGLHDSMEFTYRNPSRSTDPRRTLPSARSLVVGALDFNRRQSAQSVPPGPHARVAAYAREDHYATLRSALGVMASGLSAAGYRAVVLADQNNLVDRAAAHRAALGWWGKSSNILVPGVGSMVVIGSVLTDARLEVAVEPVADACGSCRECLDGCPTGAIVAPGVVDARRCLAWLVQAEGMFPIEFRGPLGDRIYGCDDCQDVCPPNRVRVRRPSAATDSETWVSVLDLLRADDAELMRRYGRWYIPRREPRYLRRNALVVLGNIGVSSDEEVVGVVKNLIVDPDPMLRAHAVWTARRMGLGSIVSTTDPDPDVTKEIERVVEPR